METKMIGNKIAEARKKMNISQAQLAEHLFISPQAVGKWERGESIPDLIMFNRLAKMLGVDLNYFSEDFQSAAQSVASSESVFKQPVESVDHQTTAIKRKNTLNWDMSRGNWADADFSGLKNLHEKFSSSNMLRCKFIGSDLSGLLLKDNNVNTCDFSESDFSNSQVQRSFLSGNQFKSCALNAAEFSGSFMSGCDFSGADFTNAVIKSGGIEKSTLTNTTWNNTSFSNSMLADLVFESTVESCSFDNCAFTRVTFQNATLINTFFKCRSLKKIKFINCQADRMTYEFLKNGKADLSGVTLIDQH